jgi:hypothetical protein
MGVKLSNNDEVVSAMRMSVDDSPSDIIDPQSVQGDQQQKLLTVAQSFLSAAPHQSRLRRDGFDGMRRNDPPIVMWSPAAGWRFDDYNGYRVWLLVQCGLDQRSPEAERCFVRVMSTDTMDKSSFEFYARVYGNGKMTYRTEQRGDLPPELARFVQLLGVDPAIYTMREDRYAVPFDSPSIDGGDMAASERPFLPEQAGRLAEYLAA